MNNLDLKIDNVDLKVRFVETNIRKDVRKFSDDTEIILEIFEAA